MRTACAPGPGQYTGEAVSDRQKGPKFAFGIDKKCKGPWIGDSPGPGAYEEHEL